MSNTLRTFPPPDEIRGREHHVCSYMFMYLFVTPPLRTIISSTNTVLSQAYLPNLFLRIEPKLLNNLL